MSGGQIGIYRTSDRTIELFGQYELANQKKLPIGISAIVSVDGTDNFSERFSPGDSGRPVARSRRSLALYLEPAFVGNTNDNDPTSDDDNTVMAGVGARLRILKSTYVFVETTPRFGGYTPGGNLISFRHREARRRPSVSAELLRRPWHHALADRAGQPQQRLFGLVHRLQPLAKVLLR